MGAVGSPSSFNKYNNVGVIGDVPLFLGCSRGRSEVKARYAYPLLFLAPGAMASVIVAALATATGAGFLWIFVYGDNPWPPWSSVALTVFALVVCLMVLAIAYRFGKAQESRGGLRKAHALIAIMLSFGLPLLILYHQWQVGNLGSAEVPPREIGDRPQFAREIGDRPQFVREQGIALSPLGA